MSENPQDPAAQSDQPPPQPYAAQPPPPPPMGGPAPGYAPQGAQAPVSPSDARMWSLFAHIGGIFFGFVPALIIYVMYKDRDPFVRRHSVQALNFQIMLMIAYFASFILTFLFIGIFTWMAAGILCLVFSIMGAVAANKGEEYTYPLVPQLVT